jgi:hypothetical protein
LLLPLFIIYVPLSSARQNKESEKGLFNTNKQKQKYKDIQCTGW